MRLQEGRRFYVKYLLNKDYRYLEWTIICKNKARLLYTITLI